MAEIWLELQGIFILQSNKSHISKGLESVLEIRTKDFCQLRPHSDICVLWLHEHRKGLSGNEDKVGRWLVPTLRVGAEAEQSTCSNRMWPFSSIKSAPIISHSTKEHCGAVIDFNDQGPTKDSNTA